MCGERQIFARREEKKSGREKCEDLSTTLKAQVDGGGGEVQFKLWVGQIQCGDSHAHLVQIFIVF